MSKGVRFGGHSRPLDAVYDQTYQVSDTRDHERNIFGGMRRIMDLKYEPVFDNMFTDFRNVPRAMVNCQLPANISMKQLMEQSLMNNSSNYVVSSSHESCLGMDRYKFQSAPTVSLNSYIPSDTVMALSTMHHPAAAGTDFSNNNNFSGMVRSVGVQTKYRESECQTDPYTPEYVVEAGLSPEVLNLVSLKYGNGLPAGVHEVDMIIRARKRREIEKSLPPIREILDDPAKIKHRRNILNKLEEQEWKFREGEIEQLQEMRMKILIELLRKREDNIQTLEGRRLAKLWEIKRSENEEFVAKVRYDLCRKLRKLCIQLKQKETDIISDYTDRGSEAFAPMTRKGKFLDKEAYKYAVKSPYLNTESGILELENFIKSKDLLEVKVKPPKVTERFTKEGFPKAAQRKEQALIELQEYYESIRNPKPKAGKSKSYITKIEKPVPLPPTPCLEDGNLEEEWVDSAVTCIQYMIRGRADQIRFHEGKQKRIDLIKELASTHALLAEDAKSLDKTTSLIKTAQAEQQDLIHKNELIDQHLSQFEAGTTSEMLDLLSKQLVRLLEEQKAQALAKKAQLERRLNEARESGTRQAEERRRREHEEMFKQIVKTHQETVDSYLSAIVQYTIESTADQEAEKEIQEISAQMEREDLALSQLRDELKADELASELVHCFLIPHVDRMAQKYLKNLEERVFLQAAHQEVLQTSSQIMEKTSTPSTSVPVEEEQEEEEEEGKSFAATQTVREEEGEEDVPASQ